jgi:hypothetical protein
MTDDRRWHPDLLRRFVPTPYIFDKCDGPHRSVVESNDLEIALGVRHFIMGHSQRNRVGGLRCKLILDLAAPVAGSESTIYSDGTLRILYRGAGTILVHDQERSELFGFVARDVEVHELVSLLIPALLDT